jgi:hypothetical protein
MVFRFRSDILKSLALLAFLLPAVALADGPPAFDLTGPKLTITVTRAGDTLPISQVPNLAPGDLLSIKADFPQGQAAHYLLIAAFLRGSTNPPPENWFYKSETWNKKQADGLHITVPDTAQQVLVFLAPETGGDFKTLINAVRGRPGAFVRASQDLNQASLDHSRLDTYLADVRTVAAQDPSKLKDISPVLGESLAIKVDPKCFERPEAEQANCLMQNQEGIILNDGHSTSIVQALTSGPASDLALQVSLTPQANYGAYSPYVASVLDIARILDSLHTAQYQYIPALASFKEDEMETMLNVPPSFHNPKSVLVIALPAIEDSQPPPLHAANPKERYCAEKQSVALGVQGAPLIYSTGYARDTILRVQTKDGKTVDIPVKPDALKGGLVVAPDAMKDLKPDQLGDNVTASLHGQWGFQKYDGPSFQLSNGLAAKWQLAEADHQSLVVGREDVVHLTAGDAACVEKVQLAENGKDVDAKWKQVKPDEIEVTLPLEQAKAGDLQLKVKTYGQPDAESLPLHAFDEAGHLDGFTIYAGDPTGVLKGTRLDETAKLELNGVEFDPGKLTSANGSDELVMERKGKDGAALVAGSNAKADVYLKDGREIHLDVKIGPARPVVSLIGKDIEPSSRDTGTRAGRAGNIQLTNKDELAEDAKMTFSVRAQKPGQISRDVKVEVATEDDSASTILSAKDGTLTREDRSVAVARLDPAKAFGGSAFGPLKFRVIEGDAQGDWQPLATLVRLPGLRALQCPATVNQPCNLEGDNLFLLDSIAGDPQFKNPTVVPDGFPGAELQVPHPASGRLYVKLRDDPTVVNATGLTASVPAAPAQQTVPQPVPEPAPASPAAAVAPIAVPTTHAAVAPADAPKAP